MEPDDANDIVNNKLGAWTEDVESPERMVDEEVCQNEYENDVYSNDEGGKAETQGSATAYGATGETVTEAGKSLAVEKKYKCDVCPATFRLLRESETHQKMHTSGKKFKCDKCDYETAKLFNLKSHVLRHTDIKDSPYKCGTCNQCFRKKSNLTDHENWHLSLRLHTCEQCKETFYCYRQKFIHIREKHPDMKNNGQSEMKCRKNTSCPHCAKTYESAKALSKHMRIHDANESPKCVFCNELFPTLYDLDVHSRRHTGEKPYECQVCHKKFTQKSVLNRHSQIHSQEKLHSCDKCGKKLSTKYNLKIHVKSCGLLFGIKFSNT